MTLRSIKPIYLTLRYCLSTLRHFVLCCLCYFFVRAIALMKRFEFERNLDYDEYVIVLFLTFPRILVDLQKIYPIFISE